MRIGSTRLRPRRRSGCRSRATLNHYSCMKAELLPEPELQFGGGTHVDIRFGLKNYGPLTFDDPATPSEIRLGFVGTPTTIQGVKDWLDRCRKGIPAKESRKP